MAATPITLESLETEPIRPVLNLAEDKRTQVAKMRGIDRVSLWRELKKPGIDAKDWPPPKLHTTSSP